MLGLSDYVEEYYCSAGGRHVRPIIIVSVSSKGFERLIINAQVLAHVDRSGLSSEFRSGFRRVVIVLQLL
jgi:hypothetical protein